MAYYKRHLDTNHKTVVTHLRGHGVEVIEILDPLDLLCHFQHFTGLIEVKKPNSSAVYTRRQIEFIANTRMPVAIVKQADEAFEFMKTGLGLSQKQKDALAGFLLRDSRGQWHHQLIERILG